MPNILFAIPEEFGAFNCKVEVTNEKLEEIEAQCTNVNDENIFQEYFHYVMEILGRQYPANHTEALELFHVLMEYAE